MASIVVAADIEVVNTSHVVVTENSEEEMFYVSKGVDNEDIFSCKVCEKKFTSKQGVKSHGSKMHKDNQLISQSCLKKGKKREREEELEKGEGDTELEIRKVKTIVNEIEAKKHKGDLEPEDDSEMSFLDNLDAEQTSTQFEGNEGDLASDVAKIMKEFEDVEEISDEMKAKTSEETLKDLFEDDMEASQEEASEDTSD